MAEAKHPSSYMPPGSTNTAMSLLASMRRFILSARGTRSHSNRAPTKRNPSSLCVAAASRSNRVQASLSRARRRSAASVSTVDVDPDVETGEPGVGNAAVVVVRVGVVVTAPAPASFVHEAGMLVVVPAWAFVHLRCAAAPTHRVVRRSS